MGAAVEFVAPAEAEVSARAAVRGSNADESAGLAELVGAVPVVAEPVVAELVQKSACARGSGASGGVDPVGVRLA
ncbi:MAG: hypothetical protein ABWY57_07405, partial [Mycetocola sp.]